MKKIVFYLVYTLISICALCSNIADAQVPPSFEQNFAKHLTDTTPDAEGRVETVFNICIDRNKTLAENIRLMFYPNTYAVQDACGSSRGWLIWDVIRIIGFWLIFLYLIYAGMNFVIHHDKDDKIESSKRSFLYILYGGFIFLAVTRMLWTVLNIDTLQWTKELVDNTQNRLFLQILSFFKAAAFFISILMIAYYGFRIMMAMEDEDKIKTARSWVVNVVMMLVFIKIIDYIFYIAQSPDFTTQAKEFIIIIARTLGYVMGALFIASVFYAWFQLMTSQGDDAKLSKAKNIIMSIFFSALVIFIFLLVIYQVFSEFG